GAVDGQGDVLGGGHAERETLAADAGGAGGRQQRLVVVHLQHRQDLVHGGGGGPDRALLAVQGDGDRAGVLHRDLGTLGEAGVQGRGDDVVLAELDAVLLQQLLHGAGVRADLGGGTVDGDGDGLGEGFVDAHATQPEGEDGAGGDGYDG